MKPFALVIALLLSIALGRAKADCAPEPLFQGLGYYTRTITTSSPEAQKYFNQGLNFLFGFNHGAAIRAFQAAVMADQFLNLRPTDSSWKRRFPRG